MIAILEFQATRVKEHIKGCIRGERITANPHGHPAPDPVVYEKEKKL
jgi:hypothetical protein